jgi:hypothetical protein
MSGMNMMISLTRLGQGGETVYFKDQLIEVMEDMDCEGCVSHLFGEVGCAIDFQRNGYMCPCAVCLLKSICDDSGCDIYHNYEHYLNTLENRRANE